MKILLTLLFAVCLQVTQAAAFTNYKLPELRLEYMAASKDEAAARDFYNKMEKYSGTDAVVLGYKAASEAVMAKYVWNPYYKMKHLNTAMDIFEEAVALNKENPEIRFLRFVVESHVPKYLNKSEHLQEDKSLIIEKLTQHPKSGISGQWARTMRDFLVAKDRCSEQEKQLLQSLKI